MPPAFALTTHAYTQFANSLGLPGSADGVRDDDLPQIRAQIMAAPLPSSIAEGITCGFGAFQNLANGEVALAVRSSATAEDAADFSFAGLHDTILDVRSLPESQLLQNRGW